MKRMAILILVITTFTCNCDAKESSNKTKFKEKVNKFLKKYAESNISIENPGIVRGQLAGYGTGGGISVKNDVINRRIVNVTPPSYSAGCGGIDVHLGGFSYIEKDELINALKKIGTASAAYAFILAMKTVTPQGEGAMLDLNEIQTIYNNMNLNSCEIARGLVASAWPEDTAAREHICEIVGSENGIFDSFASSKHNCTDYKQRVEENELKAHLGDSLNPPYNLTWEIIKKDPFFSNHPDLAELAMSLAGTIIVDEDNVATHYESKADNVAFMTALMLGGEAEGYKCRTNIISPEVLGKDKCIDLSEDSKFRINEDQSWFSVVNNTLLSIQEKILNESGSLTKDEINLINKSNLPILRTITAMTVYHRGCSPTDIGRLADHVAMDVLCQFVDDIIVSLRSTSKTMKEVQLHDRKIKEFLADLNRVRSDVQRYRERCHNLFRDYITHEKFLELIEGSIQQKIGL